MKTCYKQLVDRIWKNIIEGTKPKMPTGKRIHEIKFQALNLEDPQYRYRSTHNS